VLQRTLHYFLVSYKDICIREEVSNLELVWGKGFRCLASFVVFLISLSPSAMLVLPHLPQMISSAKISYGTLSAFICCAIS
jgi:hypothetical protein